MAKHRTAAPTPDEAAEAPVADLTLVHLKLLALLADQPPSNAIAELLGVHPSGVTLRMQVLEKPPWELVESPAKKWRLSAKGRRLLPRILRLLDDHDDLAKELRGHAVRPEVFRIADGVGVNPGLAAAVAGLLARHPALDVHIVNRRGDDRIREVAKGRVHAALVSHDPARIAEIAGMELERRFVRPIRFQLAAARSSPAGRALARLPELAPVPAEVLDTLRLIGPDPNSGLLRQLRDDGPRLRFAIQVGGWHRGVELARLGLGAALCTAASPAAADPALVVRPVFPHLQGTEWLIWNKAAEDPVLEHFCHHCWPTAPKPAAAL